MNDEWDLFRLRSITLAYEALQGDFDTLDTNTLRLLSTNDNDDWIISSFSDSTDRKWVQFLWYRQNITTEWCLMIECELDVQALTEEGIQIRDTESFCNVRRMNSRSMIDWLIIIKMLMLLRTTFDTRAVVTKVRIRKQSVSDHIDEVVLFVHPIEDGV